MDKISRQDNIKKEYVNATKEIIETKGVEQVSARNIAKITGFSYATLYNYFKDIDTLMTYVAIDYLDESYEYITSGLKRILNPIEKIIHCSTKYFDYMFSKPSVFKIIFINNFGEVTQETAMKLVPKVTILLKQILDEIEEKRFKMSFDSTYELISSSVHAKLMFHVFNRTSNDVKHTFNQISNEIKDMFR